MRLRLWNASTIKSYQEQMIRDNKDLVRYSTDVGLSDSGRHQKALLFAAWEAACRREHRRRKPA